MIRKFLLFLLLLVFLKTEAQQAPCQPTLRYQINTESGMKMRASPTVNSAVVIYVPAKSIILVCEELSTPATIENINGHWRRVKFKENYGYMFDGFLAPASINLTHIASAKDFKLAQLVLINSVLAQDLSKLDSVLAFLSFVAKTNGYEKIIGPPLPDRDSLFESTKIKKAKPISDAAKDARPQIQFKLVTETYNYCGDIMSLDPGKIWYGIYRKGQHFLRQRINLLIIRSKYSLGSGLEFDLKAEEDIQPVFLLSSTTLLEEDWYVTQSSDFFVQNPSALYPGQQVELYGKDPIGDMHNVNLFVTGNVTGIGACPEIKDYKIKVTAEMHNDLITQDLTPLFKTLGKCGIPEIYWFGDLNGDLYPEIIFLSKADNGFYYTFFVSDTQNKKAPYRVADQWINSKCN